MESGKKASFTGLSCLSRGDGAGCHNWRRDIIGGVSVLVKSLMKEARAMSGKREKVAADSPLNYKTV